MTASHASAEPSATPAPAIELRQVGYRYADGTTALRGVSFCVAAGECVGLVGPNGSGKSTLLLHLNGTLGLDDSGGGEVRINGRRVDRKTLYDVRREVGLLFQHADDQLFCPTVAEDVAFGPEQFGLPADEVRQRVSAALADMGLVGFEQRSPGRLSGGEKRLVCLAGVLACAPSVLVLDEPTGELDPRGRRHLKDILRGLKVAKLIATHDLELVVELCTRVVVLDGGTVVAEGPTRQVLSDEALMLAHGLERPHILQHPHPHGPHA